MIPDAVTPGIVKPSNWNAQHIFNLSLSEFSDDATHRLTTDAEKAAWNVKQDALGFTPENIGNKAIAFQPIPDDTHYPSEKLVKDSLDGKSATTHNHNLASLAERSYNSLTDKPINGATPALFTPANPTGTSGGSYVMMGLGATIKMTPLRTGKIRYAINGKCSGNAANLEIGIKAVYGTGVAPANGAAATGTVIGVIFNDGVLATAGAVNPYFTKNVIISGLIVGTAYWFDVQVARAGSATGTVSISLLEATLEELPY
jgi:hypothetical protein